MDVVVLAAGMGKRMYSSVPKVLQKLGGRPMLEWVLEAADGVEGKKAVVVVTGHGADQVESRFKDYPIRFARQNEQKGTAHAVMQALPFLSEDDSVLVLYGDVPLISAQTLNRFVKLAAGKFGILTLHLDNPTGYGRIVRQDGQVVGIVEEKDADPEQKKIHEVNTGIMVIPGSRLRQWLSEVGCNNQQNEYYLTDLVGLAVRDGVEIACLMAEDRWEVEGVNNRVQLNAMERALQRKQARQLLVAGVQLADAERIDIRGKLTCGRDVFIDVGCVFEGNVHLADNVQIGPYCVIKNSSIGEGTVVDAFTHMDGATVGNSVKAGPYCRLRPAANVMDEAHLGNFVEVKKSVVGKGSKVNHLSYIGDSEIGADVNIGAGTITCNYDGVNKFKTVIEDNVFIGSDTQLVAPVTVHRGATVAAGTTVTHDVPENVLCIRRDKRQTIVEGWRRPTKKK